MPKGTSVMAAILSVAAAILTQGSGVAAAILGQGSGMAAIFITELRIIGEVPEDRNGRIQWRGSDKHTDSENIRNQETEVETNADILSISGNVSMGTCGPRVCSTRARAKLTSASLRVISLLSMRLVV
ncbi:hypothetical protein DPX16_22052 [Anabarilius grahami]|uniref:Uncharacterized protein n=1 Tax=Anabarilius grahami TaxID=495550 RepID=A0A3N0XNC5_ANAGA|nr:hypothetical protein DPX16_22052 [Anabarilius grahami]